MHTLNRLFISGSRQLCNLFFPPQCLACDEAVGEFGTLCLNCWNGMEYLTPPRCALCGFPFTYAVEGKPLCAACTATPPPYAMARAVCRYNETSSKLALGFKYADRTHMAKTLSAWLVQAGEEFLPHAELIAPIPLHRRRLLQRRYNQSALLAQAITKHHPHLTHFPRLLTRHRATTPQAGLTRKQRQRNVRGAFLVTERYKDLVRGKHIVLVDDVLTTGATMGACTKLLLKAGARRVDALTLCQSFVGLP